jgi:hypothetical protein
MIDIHRIILPTTDVWLQQTTPSTRGFPCRPVTPAFLIKLRNFPEIEGEYCQKRINPLVLNIYADKGKEEYQIRLINIVKTNRLNQLKQTVQKLQIR